MLLEHTSDGLDLELEQLGIFSGLSALNPKAPAQPEGFDFAPEPPPGSYWPVITSAPEGRMVSYLAVDGTVQGKRSREFLAMRFNSYTKKKDRYHLGVDLFARKMEPVVACENGRIVHFMKRFLYLEGKPNYTSALFVEHDSGVTINYGEVHPNSLALTSLKVGDRVRAGQPIAFIGINPGGSSMLHFEIYRAGLKANQRWAKGEKKPTHILNPAKYLLHLRDHGLGGSAKLPAGATAAPRAPAAPTPAPAPSRPQAAFDLARAVRENQRWGDQLGWMPYYDAIAYVVGFRNESPTQELFASAIADWQAANGLDRDGVIGPNSWKKLRPLALGAPAFLLPRAPGSPAPAPAPAAPATASSEAALESELLEQMRQSWSRHGLTPPNPATFSRYSYSHNRGWARYGGPYVDTTLEQLRGKGLIRARDEDIDMLQRASNVETGGKLQALNSWDSAVMSVGFMQWTLRYGELQSWIAAAAEAFARYGIALEPLRTYAFSATDKQRAIVGAQYAKELRSKTWGIRFFFAGLDLDAVVAAVPQALAGAASVKRRLVVPRGAQSVAHYDASPEIRALIQETYNNRPAYVKTALAHTASRVATEGAVTTARYLKLLQEEIKNAYRGEDVNKAVHLIEKTAVRRLSS